MRRTLFAWLAVFGLITPVAGQSFLNSKMKRGARCFRTVLVFTGQVSLQRVGVKGVERMADEDDKFGGELSTMVSNFLTKNEVKVLAAPPEAAPGENGACTAAEMQRKYDVVERPMCRHRGGVGRGRFTLGDSVAAYAPAAQADTLVFLRGSGTVIQRPEGARKQIGNLLLMGVRGQSFDGRMAFVDARSGEVLLFVQFTSYGHGWKGTAEDLMPRILESMSEMPVSIYTLMHTPPRGK
jgi:hypothetical protein